MPDKSLREQWANATDEKVVQAFRHDKHEYSEEAQAIIEEEYTRRILVDYHEPTKEDKIKNVLGVFSWIGIILLGVIVSGLIEINSKILLEDQNLTLIEKIKLNHIDLYLGTIFVVGILGKWRRKFLIWFFGITIPIAIIQIIVTLIEIADY